MNRQRLILKQPTGWFAAGREVSQALMLLSDLSFKLYVYVCLNANRHTGKIALEPPDLARGLRKKEGTIRASLVELTSVGICQVRNREIEINDRFWPYQKQSVVPGGDDQTEFVRQVRAELQTPACVRSAFIPAEEELAIGLYHRGVTLDLVKRAIWLGCARKYLVMLKGEKRTPITSLRYFIPVIEEVSRVHAPESYWEEVRCKAEQMEKRWLQHLSNSGQFEQPTEE
jgi:hypothetical protein